MQVLVFLFLQRYFAIELISKNLIYNSERLKRFSCCLRIFTIYDYCNALLPPSDFHDLYVGALKSCAYVNKFSLRA